MPGGRRRRAPRTQPPRCSPSADALWRLPRRVDLVVVATANVAHVPLARAAIEAGIAVMVDKPLATSAAEGRDLVARAARAGVPLTVFQNRRWDGDVQTVRQLLADRALGEVIRFESRFERWRLEARTGWRGSADPAQAGGLLIDLGSHLIDQALWLFGPVADVYAELDRRRPGSDVEDDAFVAMRHASGVRLHLWMSILASQRGPRLRVLGTGGLVCEVRHGRPGGSPPAGRAARSAPAGARSREAALGLRGVRRRRPSRHQDEPRRLWRALPIACRGTGDGGRMPVDPNDAVAALDVIEAARRSARERCVVSRP